MKVSANIQIAKLHIKAMIKGKVSGNDLRKTLKSARNSTVDFKNYMYTKAILDGIKDILRNQKSNCIFKKSSLINELEYLIAPKPRESFISRLAACKNDLAECKTRRLMDQSEFKKTDIQELSRLHYLNRPGESFA
ncbi:hypothetical protein [Serratia quinivorans]|uniref:hypothetical protein n=1 Tax=Serratia quinivorans TaxID=137545 RepID=UPI003981BD2C